MEWNFKISDESSGDIRVLRGAVGTGEAAPADVYLTPVKDTRETAKQKCESLRLEESTGPQRFIFWRWPTHSLKLECKTIPI